MGSNPTCSASDPFYDIQFLIIITFDHAAPTTNATTSAAGSQWSQVTRLKTLAMRALPVDPHVGGVRLPPRHNLAKVGVEVRSVRPHHLLPEKRSLSGPLARGTAGFA